MTNCKNIIHVSRSLFTKCTLSPWLDKFVKRTSCNSDLICQSSHYTLGKTPHVYIIRQSIYQLHFWQTQQIITQSEWHLTSTKTLGNDLAKRHLGEMHQHRRSIEGSIHNFSSSLEAFFCGVPFKRKHFSHLPIV